MILAEKNEEYLLDRCTICVLTYNRSDQLTLTITNLVNEFINDNIKIIVVNNGSTDDTRNNLKELKRVFDKLEIIDSFENLGCARGREVAWRIATTEYILSMDDDIRISRNGLLCMLQTLSANNRTGLVSPIIIDAISLVALNPVDCNNSFEKSFYEACFLFKRIMLSDVGYLDPALTIAGEGLDYSIRMRKLDYLIKRDPDVKVMHFDRIRDLKTLTARNVKWLESFCYVYWKNFTPPLALIYSLRRFLGHLRVDLFSFRLLTGLTLLNAVILGSKNGRKARVVRKHKE